MKTFDTLGLIEPLRQAIHEAGYTVPTPIQSASIPDLLSGRDLLGCAQTGTGKTAAFTLPILQHLAGRPAPVGRRPIRALILAPTRELAAQIGANLETYGKHLRLRHAVIFGGVGANPQVEALRRGLDIVVATPGRFLDLANQGHVSLNELEFFVLDEADRMLDMGFIHDVRRVVRMLPARRQTMFFSATMPREVAELANTLLQDPVRVEVTPPATTVERIDASVRFVQKGDKKDLLVHLLRTLDVDRAIVFTRTKHGANRLAEGLEKSGFGAAAIHGNKSQNARDRALEGFRAGTIPVLVATDLASRGIDVEGVSHVFNYELPNEPESYVHRIGRTGRAGRSGVAISFCDDSEGVFLRDIERTIGQPVTVEDDHPWHAPSLIPPPGRGYTGARPPQPGRGGGGGGGGGRPGGSGFGGGGPRPASRGPSGGPSAGPPRGAGGGTPTGGNRAPSGGSRPAAPADGPRSSYGVPTSGGGRSPAPSAAGGGDAPARRRRRGGRGGGGGGGQSGGTN